MKNVISLLVIIILSIGCTATKKATNETKAIDNIKSDFTTYLSAIKDRDFKKSVEYMLPDFFDLIPKEELIKVMEETFNNPNMDFEIKDSKILSVSDIEKIEEKFYSKLRYSSNMSIKMNTEEALTDENKEMTLNLFKLNFGSENVSYDEQTAKYQINSEQNAISISENGINSWKFLVVEEKQRAILEQFIPKKILDSI